MRPLLETTMGFILLIVIAGIVLNLLFWGLVIYGVTKLLGRATPQQLGQVAGALGQFQGGSGHGSYTPVGDTVRGWAAQNGIDPNF